MGANQQMLLSCGAKLSYPAAVIATTPLGYYKLNESGTGAFANSSGSLPTASAQNNTFLTRQQTPLVSDNFSVLEIAGGQSGINLASPSIVFSAGSSWTIVFWWKPTATGIVQFLLSTGSGASGSLGLFLRTNSSTNKVELCTITSFTPVVRNTTTTVFNTSTNYMMAVTSDGATFTDVYVNGALDIGGSWFSGYAAQGSISWGRDFLAGTANQMYLDECAFWTRALSSTEVSTLYASR